MQNDGTLAQARAAHRLLTDASAAMEGLVNTLSTGVQCPVKVDVEAEHRREHRMGRPAKIDTDSELQAFVTARLDTLTFDQIAKKSRPTSPRPVAPAALQSTAGGRNRGDIDRRQSAVTGLHQLIPVKTGDCQT